MTALKFNSANWGTGTLYVSLHTSAPPCGVVVTCDPDDQAMPHVRFGQRWSLPDGLEVAVLDVVTPRFIGRREDGVRVVGECSDLHEHGKLVVDVPQRSEREMVANTVYREAEFPPDGMTKKAWLAEMVGYTEVEKNYHGRPYRSTHADVCRLLFEQFGGNKSWRGALELTWPAPVVAPVEPVKVEPVAERPAVRVGQVWRSVTTGEVVRVESINGVFATLFDRDHSAAMVLDGKGAPKFSHWQLVRDVEEPKSTLSRKVEVGQVWKHQNENTNVTVAQAEETWAFMGDGWAIAIRNGEPVSPCWERVS